MKNWIAGLGLVLLISGCASVANDPPQVANMNEQGYKQIVQENFSLQWKVAGENLECVVSGKTDGWVAVGFNSKKPKMDQSNFIIGYVAEGKAHIEDQIAKGWGHSKDTVQNINASSGEEKEGQTILRFTIPLADDENNQDVVLKKDEIVYVLLAIGGKDDMRSYHKAKMVMKVKL